MELIFKASFLLVYIQISFAQECVSFRPKAKIILKSERNSTGHWNAQVQLHHGGKNNATGPWEVEVEQVEEKCGDTENIIVVANILAPPQTALYSSLKPSKKPGPDYELIPGLGYYKFHADGKTWFEARETCEKENAHLVIINSEREANALLHYWVPFPKIFSDWRNDWAHVGFHDQYVEGEYVTITGQLLNTTGYWKFSPGQPDTGAYENCGCASRSTSMLADVSCGVKLPFFCENEL